MGSFAQVAVVKAGDYHCVSNKCLGDGVSGRVGAILGLQVNASGDTCALREGHQEHASTNDQSSRIPWHICTIMLHHAAPVLLAGCQVRCSGQRPEKHR